MMVRVREGGCARLKRQELKKYHRGMFNSNLLSNIDMVLPKYQLYHKLKIPQREFAGRSLRITSHPYKEHQLFYHRKLRETTHIIYNIRYSVFGCSAKKPQSPCYDQTHRKQYSRAPYTYSPDESHVDGQESNHSAGQYAGYDRSEDRNCSPVLCSVAFYVRKILDVDCG